MENIIYYNILILSVHMCMYVCVCVCVCVRVCNLLFSKNLDTLEMRAISTVAYGKNKFSKK